MKEETTTITISRTNKRRLDSILKKGESYDFGVSLLLLVFSKPKFGAGGALGPHRTVYPLFTEAEIEAIRKTLEQHGAYESMKTPTEIEEEIAEEEEEQ